MDDVDLRTDEKRNVQRMAAAILENTEEPEDITYTPRRAWIQMPTTDYLIGEMEKRREQFGWEVDFADFKMPFDNNISKKIIELYKEEA